MFITRASRHDRIDLVAFLSENDWGDSDVNEGVTFIAREGAIVGSCKFVEVAPAVVMVDDVLVKADRRRHGIGTAVMKAAMNARAGSLYLCCHDENRAFYRSLGFDDIDVNDAPPEAIAYWEKVEDIPTPEGHVHHFMKAR